MNNPIPHHSGAQKKVRGAWYPLIITIIVGLVMFYVSLPALNFQSQEFYSFVIFLLIIYAVLSVPKALKGGISFEAGRGLRFNMKSFKGPLMPLYLIAALVIFNVGGQLIASPIIRAADYKELLPVATGNFTEDVQHVNYNQIPLLDKVSAQMLGSRKLGELSDMVSQFEVATDYSQINYKERPVRVTPLMYGDFFKWIANRNEGIPAYLVIDMIDQDVEVVRLEEGIKYAPSEPFGRNYYRHLRFKYPTYMFDTPTFELDEEGTPYWIAARLQKRIGLFGGTDVQGVVLLNAITGETTYYDVADVPRWVDRVYTADLLISQYNFYGKYQNGFLNTVFSQKGMTKTTQGYNYLAMDDDVYVYTGVTSVGRDQSNIGFILSNQRTKETKYYAISGAEEFSAMNSAEGVVQHLGYKATFPLLINVNGQPTYIMALKDNAQLVKMYAMVNVSSYQIVATGETIAETEKKYNTRMASEGVPVDESTKKEITGVIQDIRSYVVEGNTVFLVKLQSDETFYKLDPRTDEIAALLTVGDIVSFTHYPVEGFMPIVPAESVKMG